MVEQSSQESVRYKTGYAARSPLLMPVMEGNMLRRDDVAVFLKSRLSLFGNKASSSSTARLS